MLNHTTASKPWVQTIECMVKMGVRLSLRQPKATLAQKIDWEAFASDCDLQVCYNIKVKNSFQVLDQEESTSLTAIKSFTEANTEAMKLLTS